MNVTDYFTGTFLKPEDLDGGPLLATITKIEEGKYEKLNLTFDNGSLLSLNVTNGRALSRAYGFETDDWIGKRIELAVGSVMFKGQPQPSIVLKPISPPTPESERTTPTRPDPSDEIPF